MDASSLESIYRSLQAAEIWVNIISFIFLGVFIAGVVGYCFVIGKTGEKPWKGLIPFYRMYVQCKKTCNNTFFILWLISTLLLVFIVVGFRAYCVAMGIDAITSQDVSNALESYLPVLAAFGIAALVVLIFKFVIECIIFYYLCKSFGYGGGLVALYVITSLPCCCYVLQFVFVPIFMMVVGFGSSKYLGNSYDNRDNPNFGLAN